jgi:hypothetical protein
MSTHRFFDIVVENEMGDMLIDKEYVLDLPEHNMDDAVDRQEFLGIMFDSVIAASGLNICSFSSQEILA